MLEKALKELFDFQRFENNQELQSVIDEVDARYPGGIILSLADEDLEMAAGGVRLTEEGKKDLKHDGNSPL